ncbi:hypothetical protein BH23GEM9_BH23GEM9_07470 [soil metagenome]
MPAPDVVVVNETLARRLWPDGEVPGRILVEGRRNLEVVGLMRDGKDVDTGEAARPFAFMPYAQRYAGNMVVHVRGDITPAAMMADIRREVRALDPNVAVDFAETLTTMTAITLFPQRFAATLVGAMGLLGLLLAGVGVYGVLMSSASAYEMPSCSRWCPCCWPRSR